jgi:hypothetical protein
MYLEHQDGTLSEQTCTYCRGAKNSVWIRDRYQHHFDKLALIKAAIWFFGTFLFATMRMSSLWAASPGIKVAHFLMFIAWGIGLIWIYVNPHPSTKKRRQPNPLTTDREKLFAGAVAAEFAVKHAWEKHNQKLDRIASQQDQIIRQQQLPPRWEPPR